MASHAVNYRGILAMIGGSACFSANDTATKFAAQYLPVSEIVAARAGVALLIAILVIAWRRELLAISAIRNPYLILRATIEAVIGVLVIYALSLMPIANFTAIILIQPFIMTAIGAIWLNEKVGWRRWAAVVAGFAGMLLVMKPATDDFELVSLVALLAALLSLSRDLLVRRIHAQVPTTVISFSTALFGVPVGLAGAAVQPWIVPDAVSLAAIVIAAVFLFGAFVLTVLAFRGTDVSAVSPFRYSIIVFAFVFGVIVFGEIPDPVSLTGIAIIVMAGLYMLHRERIRRSGQPADRPPPVLPAA
jgi:drug/metabolite transporter (DMT)-like permease